MGCGVWGAGNDSIGAAPMLSSERLSLPQAPPVPQAQDPGS